MQWLSYGLWFLYGAIHSSLPMVGGILLPAIENERLAQWRNLGSQMKENFRDDPNWQPMGYLEKLISILDTTNVILVIKLTKNKVHVISTSAIYFEGQKDLGAWRLLSFCCCPHCLSGDIWDAFPQTPPFSVTFYS